MRSLVLWIVPAISIALGLPLLFRLVGPNPYYGFRTAKAFASRANWDTLNSQAGMAMIVGGVLAIGLNLVITRLIGHWAPEYQLAVCAALDPIPVLAGLLVVHRRAGNS